MKAAVVERPGELVVRDIPEPAMGPYEARCQVLFGAVCTGTDQHLIAGRFPWPVKYPTVLGHESIGRVTEVGERVRHLAPGDLVTRVGVPALPEQDLSVNWGGFAEVALARDHRAMAEDGRPESEWRSHRINQKLPADADPAAATMIITWRETLSYATRLGVGPGSRVLVLGSGGNGLAFVSHAAHLGAACIAAVGSPAREAAARRAGAQAYVDYHADDLAAALRPWGPFDFAIDAVGKAGQADRALPALAQGGALGVYGIDDFHGLRLNPRLAPGTFTWYNGGYDEAEVHDRVVALVAAGRLDASIWLDLSHPYPLAQIGPAIEALRQRRQVKALIRISGP
ncbi:MAG: zinc-binding dehydrogenase [Gemmatimonadota bacterium]